MHMCIFYTHVCTYRDNTYAILVYVDIGQHSVQQGNYNAGFPFCTRFAKSPESKQFLFFLVLSLPVASPLQWTNVNSFT